MNLFDELRPWSEVVLDQVPGLELFDAHTHLGQNDPDGMKQTGPELVSSLELAGARGAFTFPFHEPDGYPAANDDVLAAARDSNGLLVPFCRVNPHDSPVPEAERSLENGAKGIKLHPRAEQFTLDHPKVQSIVALANERSLPVLIHAGRGIPALGLHAVQLAEEFPDARLILAHAGHLRPVLDLACRRRPAEPAVRHRLVDPGRPRGAVLAGAAGPDRVRQRRPLRQHDDLGRVPAPLGRSSSGCRRSRSARSRPSSRCGSPPASRSSRPGPAIGERERAPHLLLDRVAFFLLFSAIGTMRGVDPTEMLALARLACDVPDEIDDAPVFAAIRALLDGYDEYAAENPDERRRITFLILAATVAKTPDVPDPGGGPQSREFRSQISRSPVSVSRSSTSSIVSRT